MMKKPKLEENKDIDLTDKYEVKAKSMIETVYCPICGKETAKTYFTFFPKYNEYVCEDTDSDNAWWWIEPEGLSLDLIFCPMDGYTNKENDLIEFSLEDFGIKTIDLQNIFQSFYDEYNNKFKRGNGDQPSVYFCSKECVKKFILNQIKT